MPYMLPLPSMHQAPPPPPPADHQSSNKPPQRHHPHQLMRTVSISILVMSLPVLYVSFLHVPPAALVRDTTFWFLMSNSIIIVIAADSGMLFFGSSSGSSSVDNGGGGGLPFGVATAGGVAVAHGVAVVVPHVESQQVMVLREQQEEGASAATMRAESDAYALVPRDDQLVGHRVASSSEPADECRDIMVVTPPPSALLPGSYATAPVWNEANRTGIQLKASRSLATEEQRLRRRRHSHRGAPSSPSHSRALVPVQQDKSVVLVAEEKPQPHPLRRAATTTEARSSAAEEERESEYSRLSDEELNRRVEEFITKFNREMRMQLEREQLALAAA